MKVVLGIDPEKWLPVIGYEGFYDVSDTGRVRSCSRLVKFGRQQRTVVGRVLVPKAKRGGHLKVELWNKSGKTHQIHRLVALAHIGNVKGMHVCHRDGNPANNNVSNLYFGTQTENMADMVRHGRSTRGEKNTQSKLTKDQVMSIFNSKGVQRIVAEDHGVSRQTVGDIRCGKRWGWLTGAAS